MSLMQIFRQRSVIYDSLTCLHCGQRVAGALRWLSTHWRAAKVLCLDVQPHSLAEGDREAVQPASAYPAGGVCVLRMACTATSTPAAFPRWAAGLVPLFQNLTALHLRNIELEDLPEVPLLKHLILEKLVGCALFASHRGLASLETLYMSWPLSSHMRIIWAFRACTRLRRLFTSWGIATRLAAVGQDLRLPPACSVALELDGSDVGLPWLARLGGHLGELQLECTGTDTTAVRTSLWSAPELSQLRHVTLNVSSSSPGSPSVAQLLGSLPQCVESLCLDYLKCLPKEKAVAVMPASLRALRVKAAECRPSQGPITFGLHAGLERLCLMLWVFHVDLQCLDAEAPTGLQELVVQAREVNMDTHLAAEVAQRGRMVERCDTVDKRWAHGGAVAPIVRVVHIGQGTVHMEFRESYRHPTSRVWHWPCTCGACAECLGPEAFGGVVDACP